MKITGLNGLESISSAGSLKNPGKLEKLPGFDGSILSKETPSGKTESFDSLLHSAMDMIKETNDYSNQAGEAELAYAMGITNSTHDLQVAQMKANISLQYTVAVRNAVIEAYKEIMQLQF
ncbi:MAG: flagellar hook-basal body complex protein FliE [Lachnospiraceae bacterium]|nr:flagellar hook-basal body complex protein FliE [Lachnospiraceae bacterium]